MLTRLTKETVTTILNRMSTEFCQRLETRHEDDQYPFREFVADFITNADIAMTSPHGSQDGNWMEFAAQWGLTDDDLANMVTLMCSCGYPWN